MPSLGSGIYGPGRGDFYNPNLNQKKNQKTQKQTTLTQNDSSKAEKSPEITSVTSGKASSSLAENQNQALLNAQKLNTLAKSTSSALNQLTADDISSMSNLGAFSGLSSLLGRKNFNLQEESGGQNTITANTADSATLKQILSELSDLKTKINAEDAGSSQNSTDISGNVPKSKEISLNDKSFGKDSFSSAIKKEPKILRFNVNGYDILSTCKKIYFSETEADGTFLLTGDRKYMSENKVRSETFYFFFKTCGSEGGITKYAVTPAISQDYENEYSYLYQLTQKTELTANRTGNLVTLRASEADWKLDMLLSLDR